MTAAVKVGPDPAPAGLIADLTATGLDPKARVSIGVVDDLCNEVVSTVSKPWPKRDGSFAQGVKAPTLKGAWRVNLYQRNAVVAFFKGTVA